MRLALFALILVFLAGGLLHYVPLGEEEDSAWLHFHAGRIQARNDLNTTASLSSPPQARLLARRVEVVQRSDHALMKKVTRFLVKRLRALPQVGEVTFRKGQEEIQPGRPLPDLHLILEMPRFSRSGFLIPGRTVKATIQAALAPNPYSEVHHRVDRWTPPVLKGTLTMVLEHESVTRGFESAGARYQQAAENIAGELAGSLRKTLGGWAADHGVWGELPASLTPAYHPLPEELPLPPVEDLRRVMAGNHLMVHNRTAWLGTAADPLAVLRALRRRLLQAGWHLQDGGKEGGEPARTHFRLRRGRQRFVAFQGGDFQSTRLVRPVPAKGAPRSLVCVYQELMAVEELQAALQEMIEGEGRDLELLAFRRAMGRPQQDRFMTRLAGRKALSLEAELALADWHHRRQETELARNRLLRAHIADRAGGGKSANRMKSTARRITGGEWPLARPGEARLQELGVPLLEPGSPFVTTVAPGETVAVLHLERGPEGKEGVLHILGVQVSPPREEGGPPHFDLRMATWRGGVAAVGSTLDRKEEGWRGSLGHTYRNRSWSALADEEPDGRFEITLSTRRRQQ